MTHWLQRFLKISDHVERVRVRDYAVLLGCKATIALLDVILKVLPVLWFGLMVWMIKSCTEGC